MLIFQTFRYLATGVVTGRTKQEVRGLPLPEQEKLEHIDRIHPDKLNNFYQVVSVVCANLPGDAEDEVKGVSTDEESLQKHARWQPPSGKNKCFIKLFLPARSYVRIVLSISNFPRLFLYQFGSF